MALTAEADRIARQLAMTHGTTYLIGARDRSDDEPLLMVDGSSKREVPRQVVDELLVAGYLDDHTGPQDVINVVYRASAKALKLAPE